MESAYFKQFDCDLDDPSIGPEWMQWVEELELFLTFVNIVNDGRMKAALLHHAGSQIGKIYKTVQKNPLPTPAAVEGEENVRPIDQYADVKRKLSTYFNPRRNVFYEIHMLRSRPYAS